MKTTKILPLTSNQESRSEVLKHFNTDNNGITKIGGRCARCGRGTMNRYNGTKQRYNYWCGCVDSSDPVKDYGKAGHVATSARGQLTGIEFKPLFSTMAVKNVLVNSYNLKCKDGVWYSDFYGNTSAIKKTISALHTFEVAGLRFKDFKIKFLDDADGTVREYDFTLSNSDKFTDFIRAYR